MRRLLGPAAIRPTQFQMRPAFTSANAVPNGTDGDEPPDGRSERIRPGRPDPPAKNQPTNKPSGKDGWAEDRLRRPGPNDVRAPCRKTSISNAAEREDRPKGDRQMAAAGLERKAAAPNGKPFCLNDPPRPPYLRAPAGAPWARGFHDAGRISRGA